METNLSLASGGFASLGLLVSIGVAFWVGWDARRRGMDPGAWAAGVLLLLIVFLPLYFLFRNPILQADHSGGNYCSQCGGTLSPAAKFCTRCGRSR
jgi:hypothetical protein